jgi:hypothetical protein
MRISTIAYPKFLNDIRWMPGTNRGGMMETPISDFLIKHDAYLQSGWFFVNNNFILNAEDFTPIV